MKYQNDIDTALGQKKNYKSLVRKLKKKNAREVDNLFHTLHNEVFEEVDCLACANCCKTTSPIFRDVDIERLAKALRMPVAEFQKKYLIMDADRDWVLQTAPCPFLGEDNYCSVYEWRPKACREYPHTDRKNMQQILNLSLKNTEICPAVAKIFFAISQRNL